MAKGHKTGGRPRVVTVRVAWCLAAPHRLGYPSPDGIQLGALVDIYEHISQMTPAT
jgi:hypothetical protein